MGRMQNSSKSSVGFYCLGWRFKISHILFKKPQVLYYLFYTKSVNNIIDFLYRYKCLLRSDNDEPFSKTLFDNIERTLYYIETQLTNVDDQIKARYNSYNPTNK